MNSKDDRDRLLNDIFNEAEPSGFRQALLHQVLQCAKRRRRVRRARQAAVVLMVLGLLDRVAWWAMGPQGAVSGVVAKGYSSIDTRPFPVQAIVRTQLFRADRISVSNGPVALVRTIRVNRRVRFIDDDELLALVAPAILVRTAPHSEKLVFPNLGGRNGLPPE